MKRKNVPDEVKSYVDDAARLERDERYEEAVAILRTALGLYPELAVLHNNLGCDLANLKRWDEARHEFLQAVALSLSNRKKGITVPDSYPDEPAQNLQALGAQEKDSIRSSWVRPARSRWWRR